MRHHVEAVDATMVVVAVVSCCAADAMSLVLCARPGMSAGSACASRQVPGCNRRSAYQERKEGKTKARKKKRKNIKENKINNRKEKGKKGKERTEKKQKSRTRVLVTKIKVILVTLGRRCCERRGVNLAKDKCNHETVHVQAVWAGTAVPMTTTHKRRC